ncbi:hypothetical protein KUCAC02_026022, partial [Chaenocephalus aceratus]
SKFDAPRMYSLTPPKSPPPCRCLLCWERALAEGWSPCLSLSVIRAIPTLTSQPPSLDPQSCNVNGIPLTKSRVNTCGYHAMPLKRDARCNASVQTQEVSGLCYAFAAAAKLQMPPNSVNNIDICIQAPTFTITPPPQRSPYPTLLIKAERLQKKASDKDHLSSGLIPTTSVTTVAYKHMEATFFTFLTLK